MYLVFTTNNLNHSKTYFYIPVTEKPCDHFNVKVMDLYSRGRATILDKLNEKL